MQFKNIRNFLLILCITIGTFFGYYSFTDLGFDAQTLLTWEHSAAHGLLPYRDIFYPYGIVQYYSNQFWWAQAILLLCASLYLYIIFNFLSKIIKDRLLTWIVFAAFFYFTQKYTGFHAFVRYGSSVAFAILLAESCMKQPNAGMREYLKLGVIAGLLGSLFLDQGIYSLTIFFGVILVQTAVQWQYTNAIFPQLKQLVQKSLFALGGFVIGAVPLLIFLWYCAAWPEFITTVKHLPELAMYAKTPFFSGLRKPENLFITATIIGTLLYLSYRYLIQDKKFAYRHLAQTGLLIALTIGMYKNMIRLIDKEIIFIALLLCITLLFEYKNLLRQLFVREKYWTWYVVVLALYICTQPFFTVHSFRVKSLKQENIDAHISRLAKESGSHQLVIDYLKQQPNFNGTAFSYPTDPIFYPLLQQQPPRYVQIYDGSPESAQRDTISYIQSNGIEYVIYNLDVHAIQDGVPDYVRANTLLRYLMQNYNPITTIDHFLILQKSEHADIFESPNSSQVLTAELLQPNFGMIPLTEGMYKSEFLEKNSELVTGTATAISKQLAQKNIQGSELILSGDCMNDEVGTVTIQATDGSATKISFTCRVHSPFIINGGRVPLFFSHRQVNAIDYSHNVTDLTVYHLPNGVPELW